MAARTTSTVKLEWVMARPLWRSTCRQSWRGSPCQVSLGRVLNSQANTGMVGQAWWIGVRWGGEKERKTQGSPRLRQSW